MKKTIKNKKAQVIIEFTFSMIVVMLMLFALFKIFLWTGNDLAERRVSHEDNLNQPVTESYSDAADGPLKQIDPFFHIPEDMDAVWTGM